MKTPNLPIGEAWEKHLPGVLCLSRRQLNLQHGEVAVPLNRNHRSQLTLGGKSQQGASQQWHGKKGLWASCSMKQNNSSIYDPKEDEVNLSNLKNHMVW